MTTILIVEDDESLRELISYNLDVDGCEVLESSNGVEALDLLDDKREEIDLVVLDLNLPELSGYEVARHIKSNPSLAHIPILISTSTTQDGIINAIQAGGDDYIGKPFSIAKFKTRVDVLLNKQPR